MGPNRQSVRMDCSDELSAACIGWYRCDDNFMDILGFAPNITDIER